ncbi:MAG: S-layer homology domain-containing protein [Clostridiales bacterium]|nr:S-layer homology domain-containing protein [Clostridiales bacterium]
MRKKLSLALVLALFASMLAAPCAHQSGKAYGSHWADSYLNKLVGSNIMRGDEYGNLNPDRNITRAEFTAMLNRAFGFSENKGSAFSDVDREAWYADDISFASYQGYFQGTGSGANPSGNLTREEAVTMICRALKIEPDPIDSLVFADSRNFAAWSKGYINAATEKGMISGYGDNTFKPGNPITRGEVAKILSEVSGQIVNQPTQATLGYVNGNVTLSKSGAGLANTVIAGDLYITEGVLSGFVFLDNVTVLGTIYISGAGESNLAGSSIVMTDCSVNNIIIDLNHNKKVSIIAQGNTEIKNTVVKSNAYLEENNAKSSAFNDIQLKGPVGTKLDLSGEFTEVRLMAPGNAVSLNKGYIDSFVSDEEAVGGSLFLEKGTELGELYIDGSATVTGTGKIGYASIGANGAVIAQMPDEIYIKPGYTATINGKVMGYLEAELENATPRIANGYPKAEDITSNTVNGQATGNKPGTIFWAVKEQGGDTPTEEAMRAPKNDEFIIQSGNMPLAMSVIDAESELSAKISGLQNGGDYELFVMLVDSKDKASRVRSVDFETLDKVKPAFLSGFPKGRAVFKEGEFTEDGVAISPNAHSLDVDVVSTKDCTVRWAILPDKFTPPAPENFFAGKIAGALDTGTLSASGNTVTTFSIGGLEEDTPYEVYLGLEDARGNVSGIAKVALRTVDITPPKYEVPYPMLGTVSEKSIEIKYMTDEAATLYWALLARGSRFPPGVPEGGTVTNSLGDIVSYWTTEPAKQAVIIGSTAVKNGNVKTTAKKEGKLALTGLDPEKSYDLYMVAVDAAGNKSVVGKMEVSTLSVLPPTAKMAFDEAVTLPGGDPPVGSVIMIAFNKPVKAGKKDEPALDLIKMTADRLAGYFSLYKINPSGHPDGPRTEIQIDFENVTVSEDLGYTVVNFLTTGIESPSPEAAVQMESGGKYYFELNNIMDMSNLAMRPNTGAGTTRLQDFRMKAPFVNLRNVAATNGAYDLLFDVDPQMTDAAETLLYDNVFETSRKITFNLYRVDDSLTNPEIANGTLIDSGLTMEAGNYYYAMQSLLQSGRMQIFKELKKIRYGIVITAVDGDTERSRWDGRITFSVRGLSGETDAMNALVYHGNDPSMDFAAFMGTEDAEGLSVVSDPAKFDRVIYFQDMTAPLFVHPPEKNPSFVAGDSTIQMSVVLDKPGTVYWLAAPVASVSDPSVVTADQLMNGTYRPAGYKSGKFDVPSGNAQTNDFIRGLVPKPSGGGDSVYYVFYLARSNAASSIRYEEVKMDTVIKPVFASGYPRGGSPGNKSATMLTQLAKDSPDAIVYWAAYRSGTWPNATGSMPDAGTISQAGQSSGGMTDWGNFTIAGGEIPPLNTTMVKNLLEGVYYDVFLVARNPLSDPTEDAWTSVVQIDPPLTALDASPPQIEPGSTSFSKYPMPGSTEVPRKYSGSITVSFTKPLYYKLTATGSASPLVTGVLTEKNSDGALRYLTITTGTFSIRAIDSQTGSPDTSPINTFTIDFNDVVPNSTISLNLLVGGGGGADDAGYFKMTFIEDRNDYESSYWKVEFAAKP